MSPWKHECIFGSALGVIAAILRGPHCDLTGLPTTQRNVLTFPKLAFHSLSRPSN